MSFKTKIAILQAQIALKCAEVRADSRWITLNGGKSAETGENTGSHVLIDDNGEIIAGAGGKLNGKKLGKFSSKGTSLGKVSKVRTAKGTEIETRFKIISANDLITSHDAFGHRNEKFPQELQPRDRSKGTSQAWISRVSKNLDIDSLGKTRRADSGAPIIGDDNVVESGNGRTMAIAQAYQNGTAKDYEEWLRDEAEDFGIDPRQLKGIKNPVLVRVRQSDVNRSIFTKEANEDDKLAMTATEKAKSDAEKLTPELVSKLAQNGDLKAVDNDKFIQGFIKTLSDSDAAQYFTTRGKLTKQIYDRVQSAVFSKAYDDDRLLELMADDNNPEIKNIITALNQAAPDFIKSRNDNNHGHAVAVEKIVDGIDLSMNKQAVDKIIEASNAILESKNRGLSLDDYINQNDIFGGSIDPDVAALALFIKNNNRSHTKMAAAFKSIAQDIDRESEKASTTSIFGDDSVSLSDIIRKAIGENSYELRADSAYDANPNPTEAQKSAGNYRKGHITAAGLRIAIENPKGSTRSGINRDGKHWQNTMKDHYGYIKSTNGADNDPVDVFVNPEIKPNFDGRVYVVNQIDPELKRFDEHKVMVGYDDLKAAQAAYKRNYVRGWGGMGDVIAMSVPVFKRWLTQGSTRPAVATETRADAYWITVHGGEDPETGEATGSRVLINSSGTVVGGAGGKLNGQKFDRVRSKSKEVSDRNAKPEKPQKIGEHVRDFLVKTHDLESLPEEKKQKVKELMQEFKGLGYVDTRTEIGPNQSGRITEKQQADINKKASRAQDIEREVKELMTPQAQVDKEQAEKNAKEKQAKLDQLNAHLNMMENLYKSKLDSPRGNKTKQDYEAIKAQRDALQKETNNLLKHEKNAQSPSKSNNNQEGEKMNDQHDKSQAQRWGGKNNPESTAIEQNWIDKYQKIREEKGHNDAEKYLTSIVDIPERSIHDRVIMRANWNNQWKERFFAEIEKTNQAAAEKLEKEKAEKKKKAFEKKAEKENRASISDVSKKVLESKFLSAAERKFLDDIKSKRKLTVKQEDWLRKIAARGGVKIEGDFVGRMSATEKYEQKNSESGKYASSESEAYRRFDIPVYDKENKRWYDAEV